MRISLLQCARSSNLRRPSSLPCVVAAVAVALAVLRHNIKNAVLFTEYGWEAVYVTP